MKKINFYLSLICFFLLNGCMASQDEIKELKVKVVNLETILNTQINTQNQKYEELEKKIIETNQKIDSLENKISKDLLVDIKTQIFSELEEIKKEQTFLSNKLEELRVSKEEQERGINSQLSNLSTQIQALQLKISELEKKIETIHNATTAKIISEGKPTEVPEEKTKKEISEKHFAEIELYEKAYSYYQKGELEKARQFFEEYIKRFPKGKWIGQAYFWIGESYFKEKKYEEAILSYQKLIELEGWHLLKPSAMLKQALSFKALGDVEAYRILLKKLINQYPNSKEAQEAKKLLKG